MGRASRFLRLVFSSRRRHTRYWRDWSSDVCSSDLEQMYRFARAARIYDGPDEVHRQSVARHILHGYQPPLDGVPSEHLPTRRELSRERFRELLETVTAND